MSLENKAESLEAVDDVRFIYRSNAAQLSFISSTQAVSLEPVYQNVQGRIYLTPTELIYLDLEGKQEIRILYSLISSIEKLATTKHGFGLRFHTKDFQCADFIIGKEKDCTDLFTKLNQTKPTSFNQLYCFLYQADDSMEQTWDTFSLRTEFMRMGVPNAEWQEELCNSSYDLCETYPSILYVPSTATKSILMGSAKFRSRGRLPVLTYLHGNGASITRCAQPLAGVNARSSDDEQLLQLIIKTNPHSTTMYIVDTRPRINAMANRAAGKGYENEDYYTNMQFKFCPIENIHKMRASLQKLIEVCETRNLTMSQFLSGLESSNWLQHIRAILDSATIIARAVEVERKNVLVHCSDGWDRTAQCCSLAALLLSPYYRSIHGFQMLIEKEWVSFGHKFSDRCGHLNTEENKEQSPVFLQFIEVVWQLTEMYPTVFEFNERFLIALHEHCQSCRYGNFIGNCEKDRTELSVKDRTYSFWNFVLRNVHNFKNPCFLPRSKQANEVLLPTINSQTFKFWLNMYQRYDVSLLPRETRMNASTHLLDHTDALNEHARLLEKRIQELRSILQSQSNSISSSESSSMGHTEKINNQQRRIECESIAIDWQPYHSLMSCICSSPLDYFERKYNCWRCGYMFCMRCVDRKTRLPGVYSQTVPSMVCNICTRWVKNSQKKLIPITNA